MASQGRAEENFLHILYMMLKMWQGEEAAAHPSKEDEH